MHFCTRIWQCKNKFKAVVNAGSSVLLQIFLEVCVGHSSTFPLLSIEHTFESPKLTWRDDRKARPSEKGEAIVGIVAYCMGF